MSHMHFTRILVIVGWAAGLVIFPTLGSGPAKACVIFTRSPLATSATSDNCTLVPWEENSASKSDQEAEADDDFAPLDRFGFVSWSVSDDSLQVIAVGIAGRRGATKVAGLGPDLSDVTVSDPAGAHRSDGVQHSLLGDHVVLAGSSGKPTNGRAAFYDDALWEAAKDLARDIISPDGDIAAIIRLGVEVSHSIDYFFGPSNAAAAGLGPADVADPELRANGIRRAGSSFHEVGSLGYYLAALDHFIFSRDSLIAALVIIVAYIAVVGLQSLIRASR